MLGARGLNKQAWMARDKVSPQSFRGTTEYPCQIDWSQWLRLTRGDQLTITCISIHERAHSLHSAPLTLWQPLPAALGQIAERVAP